MSQCSPFIAREGLVPFVSHCTPLPNPGSGSHLFLDSCIPISAPAKSGCKSAPPPFMSNASLLDHSFTHPFPADDFSALSVSCPPLFAPAQPGCNSGALPISPSTFFRDHLHVLPFFPSSFIHPYPMDDFSAQSVSCPYVPYSHP